MQNNQQRKHIRKGLLMDINSLLQPDIEPIDEVKPLIAIGACFDIPTGFMMDGLYGNKVLNGGLGVLDAVVGPGNSFKSTILHYRVLTACSRISKDSTCSTYDTEVNIHAWHLRDFQKGVFTIKDDVDWLRTKRWVVTNSAIYSGDEWYDKFRDFLFAKKKHKKQLERETGFLDPETGKAMKMVLPTFTEVDSFSQFKTKDVIKMQEDNSLGDSGANTSFMRQGLQKTRFLDEIPPLANGTYSFVSLTAHFGEKIEMDPRNPSRKQLSALRQNEKIMGVPRLFLYLMDNCWLTQNTSRNNNQTTGAPEFPRTPEENQLKGSTDQNIVTLKQLRSKSGPEGAILRIFVSQSEGVIPYMTEFLNIKENGKNDKPGNKNGFGLDGSVQDYFCVLCPEIKLSRTKVFGKAKEHPELRRAFNICSEMLQMRTQWAEKYASYGKDFFCDPQQLFDDLTAAGYDWNMILHLTRGWTPLLGEHMDTLELSTFDLLRMRRGEYHPYWLEADKKTIKKEWAKGLDKELLEKLGINK